MKWFRKKLSSPKRREPTLNGGLTERLSHEKKLVHPDAPVDSGANPGRGKTVKPKRTCPHFSLAVMFPRPGKRTGKKDVPTETPVTGIGSILIGIPFGGADFWLRLHADGSGERLLGLPDTQETAPSFAGARVFRLAMYDKALLFPKNLKGKALRNAMIRDKEVSDMPASVMAHQLRWFTRKSSVVFHGRPVHPLGASLWAYARKQGWNPQDGILLRTSIPMQESTLWIYVAMGKTGLGLPQTAIIPKESDRPSYNHTLSAGILPKEHPVHDIPADQLYDWLARGKHLRYPQPTEWFGLPMSRVGQSVLVSGILFGLVGSGIWWFGQSHLTQEEHTKETLRLAQMRLAHMRQVFLRHHLFVIAEQFAIPLHRDIAAARVLWKPGTRVVLADGLGLNTGISTGEPILRKPGAAGVTQHSPAQIAIQIPEIKNRGPGQPDWVSAALMDAVIRQPPFDGFTLHSIQTNTEGNGYVVIFSQYP
ncbi:hypothetical protein Atc_2043 [Acidithiobacillus caldus SM-1]|uniref:Uncharacterized protein n=1 Tax=Acidithiobacillus caldus (strain SM-1) TaxID=990288 RepID=F9ZQK9_ACICS|nr:hypothetical protein Atc_2043 [Acidithiobacillus caldus SM-1]